MTRARSKSWFWRICAGFLAGGLIVLVQRPAAARDTFPELVHKKLGTDCVPSCLLCHTDVPGTKANRRNDGLAAALLTAKGGRVYDEDVDVLLEGMLDGTLMPPGDSDNDGVDDLLELQQNTDPHGDGKLCVETPTYGCGARVAPREPTRLGALAFALVSGFALFRRRRRCR